MKCRHCKREVTQSFVDLGAAPPSNAYLTLGDLSTPEVYYPLRVRVCTHCWLVQTEDFASADELFSPQYAYFSSVSVSWLEHAAAYAQMIIERLHLNEASFVMEVASNDGYLLKNFVAAGIPCLGIEPTDSTATVAEDSGVSVLREFFGLVLAKRLKIDGKQADLIIGNNVLAHVPDINDFVAGLEAALKPGGSITLEFPHLMRLLEHTQFDTVYHEHFSYLSLSTIIRIFQSGGLRVYDVEELPTHGGSLRIYGCHRGDARETSAAVHGLVQEESTRGLDKVDVYQEFQGRADRVKNDLLAFLIEQKRSGASVAAYGAAAKGNTLLNYAGVKPDLLPYVCDAGSFKQDKFLPGTRIPILHPQALRERRPQFVLILPWNIEREVTMQHDYIREWGGKFVTAIPALREVI